MMSLGSGWVFNACPLLTQIPSSVWRSILKCVYTGNVPTPLLITPQSLVGLVRDSQSIVPLRPNLELSSLGHVLDAFERFVFLTVHVQSVHLQPC